MDQEREPRRIAPSERFLGVLCVLFAVVLLFFIVLMLRGG